TTLSPGREKRQKTGDAFLTTAKRAAAAAPDYASPRACLAGCLPEAAHAPALLPGPVFRCVRPRPRYPHEGKGSTLLCRGLPLLWHGLPTVPRRLTEGLLFRRDDPAMERYRIHPEAAVYYVTYSVVEWLPVFVTEATFRIVTESLAFCHKQ